VEPRPDRGHLDARLGRLVLAAPHAQARLDYGNQDFSGGLTTAWLGSSLLISPDEQLRFWARWWPGELEVSKRAVELTKTLTLVGTSPAGWTLHGKTGSCRGVGWYVGHVEKGDREYVFVASFTDRNPKDDRPAGYVARDLALQILGALGRY
jgi:beta-lactamase class D